MSDLPIQKCIEESQRRAMSDDQFVGSNEHLHLLEIYASQRVADVALRWADRSYSQRFAGGVLIAIKRPSAYAIESEVERVRLAAQYLVHEIHHALHSDHAALIAYEEETVKRRSKGGKINPDWVVDLCNELEDARLLQRARQQDLADVDSLEAIHRIGFEKSLGHYEESYGSTPWGQSPASPGEQLSLAVAALVLVEERFDLTEENEVVVRRIAAHVEAARNGDFASVVAATEAIADIVENA